MTPHKVYISYAWGGESERIAEGIEKALEEKGLEIIRDKKHLGYKGLIKQFMQDLGAGNAIITVISDKYLKSENCMFELLEIAENKDFYDRVFPIILKDAKLYKANDRIPYIKHWEGEIKTLNESLKSLDSYANTHGIREDIDLYTKIREMFAGLVDMLGDMNTLTTEIHEDGNYEALYSAIIEKLNASPPSDINKSNKDMKKNTANVKGDRNIMIQDTSKSKIDFGKGKAKKGLDIYQITGIVIGILALIVTIIIGWDEILNFFGA